ncbi:hypothetical protein MUU53_10225 [Rhizobium lemnae]|uniref:Uncharacterized protein n=1 Tax=Rhizobium lemnae TaxID=1214924 RepID=A0ABV8E7W1_9HYPH|nr:hypothetical protein [Rhizobium lemnae]MCJ8508289.1 hypothetical protein [Rhizobium lemnae]
MPGRTVPPAQPGVTVDGSDSQVGFTLTRTSDHTADMTITGNLSELGRPGTPSSAHAYYLPFTNGGATTIRVPRHPSPSDPQFVVTGPFTGCSFYVREDPTDPNSLMFTHDPRRGVGTTTSPTGIPAGAIGMSFDNNYGRAHNMPPFTVPSASAFAAYDRANGRWVMHVQNATVQVPPPGSNQRTTIQRQRVPGQIEGAYIPIDFRPSRPPDIGPSNSVTDEGFSSWATFAETGAGTGAALGGLAGPWGALAGAVAGGIVGSSAWLFRWTQHHDTSRP